MLDRAKQISHEVGIFYCCVTPIHEDVYQFIIIYVFFKAFVRFLRRSIGRLGLFETRRIASAATSVLRTYAVGASAPPNMEKREINQAQPSLITVTRSVGILIISIHKRTMQDRAHGQSSSVTSLIFSSLFASRGHKEMLK